ncbi:penicillin-binding protein [Salmonella bongori]|nr:penicillin-binding protein [Salmonella bongori]
MRRDNIVLHMIWPYSPGRSFTANLSFITCTAEKSLTWNGITQQNRNGLLWDKTMHIDGLKTGHTSGAGFNLIASAVDGQRRLIAVVMGAKSSKGREEQARKLLQWGQQNFADSTDSAPRQKKWAASESGMATKKTLRWVQNRISLDGIA